MAIPLYLAMTPAEFQNTQTLPPNIAWMSCHFSPGGKGLSNLPLQLPPGSLLILDDRFPPDGHDIQYIKSQLEDALPALACCGLLLDFQRPEDQQTAQIVHCLLELNIPVGVSSCYAQCTDHPVFLPPCPITEPLADYLAPWKDREIWLEISTGSVCARISRQGCRMDETAETSFPHRDADLFCHYRIEAAPAELRFHIARTEEDQKTLMEQAERYGITKAIGLYQELGK